MSNHSPYARSTLDGTSSCLYRRLATRCTIAPADWGDKWTIRSPPLAIPVSRLKDDDYSVTNCAVIMTMKVKKSSQHRCDTVPDTIKALLQFKIKVRAHTRNRDSFLTPKRGQHLKLTFIIWLELRRVCPDNLVGHFFVGKKGKTSLPVDLTSTKIYLTCEKKNMAI